MSDSPTTLTEDDVFDILASGRRREVIRVLAEGPVSVRDIAESLAAVEHDIERADVEYDQRQTIHVSLQQSHLPKLAGYEVVIWDRESQLVAPGTEFRPLIEVLRSVPDHCTADG